MDSELAVGFGHLGIAHRQSGLESRRDDQRPDLDRDLLSESLLWDECGVRVLKEPVMCVLWEGGEAELQRENGLYFVEAVVSS